MLTQLEPLLGRWAVEASTGGQVTARGWASFEFIEDGAFVLHRADASLPDEHTPREWISPFPVTVLIGGDDFTGRCSYLYSDARGVRRVYSMTLDDGMWTIAGRPGASFFQRFEGRFSPDGAAIAAWWERSPDGVAWEKDFDLAYTRQ